MINNGNPLFKTTQNSFAQQVIKTAAGKPIILLLINGGALGIEKLVGTPGIQSIIEGFYPGLRGAEALARTIFGQYNKCVVDEWGEGVNISLIEFSTIIRWGKMSYTTYKSSYITDCALTDFNTPPLTIP